MKDLIERLEKGDGPDRELDNLIWFYLGQPLPDDCAECPARYTASLDAALSLVPEGMAWTLGQNVHHRYWQASVNNLDEEGRPQSIGYSGLQGNLTAPVALCIAALKARAAQRDMEAGR